MVHKLNSGQPIHVALVGGSVTWGQGAVHCGNFGRRFFTWLNATWPGAPHRLTNAAKPSITSSLYALCGNDMIPQVGAALPARPSATHAQLQPCLPVSPGMLNMHVVAAGCGYYHLGVCFQ